ncbi:M48 family metallopeptidase [Agrobacterium sp. V1]|uniref:tetratricopeptide repeat protein n=1 Tax=Agrobacterium sp. V1 TaxID=3061957 RepID=UPI0026729DA9|nr:tetratricopeptide repeat protein [Agrobacterium sp. V1]MDO3445254.1 hypothetical protein [Agrobacterium sp. V1]
MILGPKIEQQLPGPDTVRRALDHLFASDVFSKSERMRSFLEYIVIETIEGRGDRIKAYSIALEVFGRQADFDGTEDPIVRTAANRLRNALERYNASPQSKLSPLLISLPRGRYVPVFESNSDEEPNADTQEKNEVSTLALPRRYLSWRVIVIVLSFIAVTILGSIQLLPNLFNKATASRGATVPLLLVQNTQFTPGSDPAERLAHDLSELIAIKLAAHGSAGVVDLAREPGNVAYETAGRNLTRVVYTLDSAIVDQGGELALVWKLNDAHTREVSWTDHVSLGTPNEDTVNNAVDALVRGVVGMEGAIASLESTHQGEISCLSPRERVALVYVDQSLPDIRACLESVVSKYPLNSQAWAILARVYFRLGRDAASRGEDPSEYGGLLRTAAQKAMDLSPRSFAPQLAALYVAYSAGDLDTYERLSRKMLTVFQDPHLKLIVGNALWSIGQRDEGVELVAKGIEETGDVGSLGYLVLASDRYERQDFTGALEMLERIYRREFYRIDLLQAAALAKLGRKDDARAAIQRLHDKRPGYENHLYFDFRHNNFPEPMIEHLAEGLREAGLIVPIPVENPK